jgi:hypothetical protein
MRKIILILINISCFSVNAQTFDIYDNQTEYGAINGAYYKDVTVFRDQFVGTWIYTNGNTSLTLVFQKKNGLNHNNGIKSFKEDVLVGEYKFIENGFTKVNTLNNISTNYGTDYYQVRDNHFLFGDMAISKMIKPKCEDCQADEKRMSMTLGEPGYDGMGVSDNTFVIRRFFENEVEKLKVWFINETQLAFINDDGSESSPVPYKLPVGEYILTKQY